MSAFADRTGLTSSRPPRRYLWTDAFAVCTFLALDQADLAQRLVDQVHRILGRHRHGGGWLSGLSEQEGAAHPTRGGLRIGKPMEERAPGEPMDDRLEWERDGQYFHYLTKWMHALNRVAQVTGREQYLAWARELAAAAARAFVHQTGARQQRMYWKMSTDLSRPQVAAMGQHDPLDGCITCTEIGAAGEAAIFAEMIDTRALTTTDPLGIGGLLADAWRLEQMKQRQLWPAGDELPRILLDAAKRGLAYYLELPDLRAPAGDRLAFRELGLAIGLAAPLEDLRSFQPVRAEIEAFWSDPAHRREPAWTNHQDINEVMLATALTPLCFLAVLP